MEQATIYSNLNINKLLIISYSIAPFLDTSLLSYPNCRFYIVLVSICIFTCYLLRVFQLCMPKIYKGSELFRQLLNCSLTTSITSNIFYSKSSDMMLFFYLPTVLS